MLTRPLRSCLPLLVTVVFATFGEARAQQPFFRPLTVDGDARRYLTYLPAAFDASENMPVMMWFHGGGGTANEALNVEADFRAKADAERFILVYPEAFPDQLESCLCWGYDFDGETNGNYQKDLAFTSAVIDDLVLTYNANRTRIYAGGYSMGASFVWDFACARSDEVAAIAPVAANMYTWTFENCDAAAQTPVCHILGTDDFYAPYDGAFWAPSVAAQNAFWIAKNATEPDAEVTSLGNGVTRYNWPPGEACHGFQHFRRQNGGHDVPSFAVDAIWEFVSQYDIDGLLTCNPGCNDADIAEPFNTLDAADVTTHVQLVDSADPSGDFNADGLIDFFDVVDFLIAFDAGCP